MYQNKGGELYNLNYAQVSSVAIDPIEKKPLVHFFPGSTVFSLGGGAAIFIAGIARTGKYPALIYRKRAGRYSRWKL
jgi:hypothetical protein